MSLYTVDKTQTSAWGMKYRPDTVEECILPKETKAQIRGILDSGKLPPMLFHSSTSGSGKSSLAISICRELDADVLFMNASLDNSIDDARTTITQFCSSVSLDDKPKVVVLDEFCFSSQNMQAAVRGILEQYQNVTFIFTCNYIHKVMNAIQSRCSVIEFKIPQEERQDLLKQFIRRVFQILEAEGIEYDPKVVVQFVTKYAPDYRKTLNELQRYAQGGAIDVGILNSVADVRIDGLVAGLKNKDFGGVRKWISENSGTDWTTFYGKLYEVLYEKVQSSSIPSLVLLLAKYQYQAGQVVDQTLNFSAFCIETMGEVQFK